MNLQNSEHNWEDRKSGRRWLKPVLILLISVVVLVAIFASPIRKSPKLKGLWNSHAAAASDKRRGRSRHKSKSSSSSSSSRSRSNRRKPRPPSPPRYSISQIKCGQKLQRRLGKYQTHFYRFAVPADVKTVVIRTCGSSFNTKLDLYKDRDIKNGWKRRCDKCECELDVVTYRAKADQLQAGKRYTVRVKDSRNAGGKYQIKLECKKAPPICKTAECYKLSGLLLETMDLTANPCTDFVKYACGSWKDGELSALSRTVVRTKQDEMLDLSTEAVLGELTFGTKFSSSQTLQKARIFYGSCMRGRKQPLDITESIFTGSGLGFEAWQNGGQPSSWTENAIGDFQSKTAWLALRAWNPMINIDAYDSKALHLFAGLDFQDPGALEQLLYEADTYLNDKISGDPDEVERIVDNVTAFLNLLQALQMQLPFSATEQSGHVWRFGSIDAVELIDGTYNLTILDLPSIVMKMYGISSVEKVTVQTVSSIGKYYADLEQLLEDTPPETVHYALTFSTITGWKEQVPIQARDQDRVAFCFDQFKVQFPFMYGHMLALLKYPKSKLKLTRKMTLEIRATLRRSIEKAVWLDKLSRQRSLLKLRTLKLLVGYPENMFKTDMVDAWYSGVEPLSTSFPHNIKIMVEYGIGQEQQLFNGILPSEIVHPWPKKIFLDRSFYPAWLTGVNAFYFADFAFFAVPGSVQQRNIFDDFWPDYMNYASIAMISAREIGHAFDAQGSKFNYRGELSDIWTDTSRASYGELMSCFVDQYDSLKVEPGYDQMANGSFTLGENVADGIGLAASYQAWERYSKWNERVPFFESMTPEQMFFVSYGNHWCSAWQPGIYARVAADNLDPHSVPPVRMLGAIQNMAEFATAFNCPVGVPSNPTQSRCKVW